MKYREALIAGARAIGIALEDRVADQMSAHHALVLKWAEKMNLTSVKDEVEAAHLHGLDSLLFVPLIRPGILQVTDVGSGAGFPGIVVAIARPELAMTLLEPRRKRASFLRVACAELGLSARVIEGKLEPEGVPSAPGAFPADIILSRATIPPLELIARAGPALNANGTLIVTQGAGAPEISELRDAARRVGLTHSARHAFELPGHVTRVLDVFAR